MRGILVRSAMRIVAITLAFCTAPVVVLLVWIGTRSHGELDRIRDALGERSVLALIGVGTVALVVAAVSISHSIAKQQAQDIITPLEELAARTERLGASDPRQPPLKSGIVEMDRLGDALARGAQQVSRRLAAERDFAADASHQLRTPLTALLMRLEEIAETDDLDVVAEEVHIAIDQVERLSGTVDDLLGRTRSGIETHASVSLDSVLASLQREWQPAFANARRSIHIAGDRGLKVRATPIALAQILTTLLENSLQHGAGTVAVSARRSGPSVVVEVTDQGAGVPADIAQRVFEREVSSSDSGLGLSLARDLAEAHGGRLELLSARPAVFALFLSEG